MCGISGIISSRTFEPAQRQAIREMARIQHHRGPDSTGFAEYPNVLLAHNRLSLIDYSDNGLMSLKSDYLYV
jgi:asparagine synthase (glutamine-hydrolysing)